MSQLNKTHSKSELNNDQNQVKQKHIDTVVTAIINKQNQKQSITLTSQTYPDVYTNIKHTLQQFDMSINQCKKYNQAKIHRKYEIRIQDLENEIKILKERLEQEQRARSPSKKYVQQLIEKLVLYRDQNQKLQMKNIQYENSKYRNSKGMQDSQSIRKTEDLKDKNTDFKNKNSIENPQQLISESIKQFLRQKNQEKRIKSMKKSHFQSFLIKNRAQLQSWTLKDLLIKIDSWSHQLQSRTIIQEQSSFKTHSIPTLSDDNMFITKQLTRLPKISNSEIKIPPKSRTKANSYLDDLMQMRINKKKKQSSRRGFSTIQVMQRKSKYKLM